MGAPAESRTVPETMIAGRGPGAGVCAKAGSQLVAKKRPTAAKHTVRGPLMDWAFMPRILLTSGPLAKVAPFTLLFGSFLRRPLDQ